MQRRGVAVVDGLAAGNSDGVGLDLDIEGRLADARQLGDQHDIVTLPKDVERRVGAADARKAADCQLGRTAALFFGGSLLKAGKDPGPLARRRGGGWHGVVTVIISEYGAVVPG